jgi:bifunctional DNase/RNase
MKQPSLALALALLLSSCSPDPVPDPEVAVRVETVTLDPKSNSPVLVLGEVEGSRRLPIWIGFSEARSIASVLENQSHPRPNTHDLAKRLIDHLEGTVERIVVTRLSEDIYYALIVVKADGRIVEVDSRPSDAIAIGLRYQAPLFVREAVFERTVEDRTGEEPGREVRNVPPPDRPEFHRQLVSFRPRIQNTNAVSRPGGNSTVPSPPEPDRRSPARLY